MHWTAIAGILYSFPAKLLLNDCPLLSYNWECWSTTLLLLLKSLSYKVSEFVVTVYLQSYVTSSNWDKIYLSWFCQW